MRGGLLVRRGVENTRPKCGRSSPVRRQPSAIRRHQSRLSERARPLLGDSTPRCLAETRLCKEMILTARLILRGSENKPRRRAHEPIGVVWHSFNLTDRQEVDAKCPYANRFFTQPTIGSPSRASNAAPGAGMCVASSNLPTWFPPAGASNSAIGKSVPK